MQLGLFPNIRRSIYLVANSPRRAFYNLFIEENMGVFTIIKKSGIGTKILDVRRWRVASWETAVKVFDRKVKEKTNPNRKSSRHYEVKNESLDNR